jgi:hypothetical protein
MARSGDSMTAKFATAVLVWQMLVHGLFGCCTHHTQGQVALTADESRIAAADLAAAHAESSDSHDEHSCPGDVPRCVFVSMSPLDLSALSRAGFAGPAVSPLAEVISPPVNSRQTVVPPFPFESLSAQERCAQWQTWLL